MSRKPQRKPDLPLNHRNKLSGEPNPVNHIRFLLGGGENQELQHALVGVGRTQDAEGVGEDPGGRLVAKVDWKVQVAGYRHGVPSRCERALQAHLRYTEVADPFRP
tara:strand:- start:7438 stop:7755 length:318 start_codon:yes stop_codon:yes gene_type:complete